MLKALADGETDPAALAVLADQRLRATPAQLHDALGACMELNPVYRRLVKMALLDLELIEQQISQGIRIKPGIESCLWPMEHQRFHTSALPSHRLRRPRVGPDSPTRNIRVINLSLGRPVYESYTLDPLCQAVEQAWKAGIVVVVAAGNEGRNNAANTSGYGTITAPGNDPYVITVGAMNTKGTPSRADDVIASYSSKGPTP